MTPASRKNKGRMLQKFICSLISSSFSELKEDDVVSRSMGSSGADCIMSPKAQYIFPVTTECKNTVATPSFAALEQAIFNCYENTVPVVAWKPGRKGMEDTLAILKYSDLIKLVSIVRKNNVS